MNELTPTSRSMTPVGKKQIKRTRASHRCEPCIRRKVKCDKRHPLCDRCRKSGETCIYASEGGGEMKDSGIDHDYLTQKRRKLDDSTSDAFPESITYNLKTIEEHLARTADLVNGLKQKGFHRDGQVNVSSAHRAQIHQFHTGEDYTINEVRSAHTETSPMAHREGNTSSNPDELVSYQSIVAKIDQFNRILQSLEDHHTTNLEGSGEVAPPTDVSLRTNYQSSKVAGPSIDLNRMSRPLSNHVNEPPTPSMMMPPEEDANVLFRCWLTSVYSVFPIVSLDLVLSKYGEFWTWYKTGLDRGLSNPDLSFMPLLYAILYGGAVSITTRAFKKMVSWTTRARCLSDSRIRFEESLRDCDYPSKPSLFPLLASLMIQSIRIHQKDAIQSSKDILTSIRIAQQLRMHSEQFLVSMPVPAAEMKRRTWWELFNIDIALATAHGLPPLSNEPFSDTALCMEFKDSKLATLEASNYLTSIKQGLKPTDTADDPASDDSSSIICVYYLVSRARHIMANAAFRILKMNTGLRNSDANRVKEEWTNINSVAKDIEIMIYRIPSRGFPESNFLTESDCKLVPADCTTALKEPISIQEINGFMDFDRSSLLMDPPLALFYHRSHLAFNKWARITLSMMIDRLYCLSYTPFLKDRESKLWTVARESALEHCHGFMKKFVTLATDMELEQFRWCWPGLFQPMHAMLIVLVDLYERPRSPEASDLRATIDKVFSLSNPDFGIVGGEYGVSKIVPFQEGGESVLKILRELRDNAWRKAQLDPEVLWTEDDQRQVGLCDPLPSGQVVPTLRTDELNHRGETDNDTSSLPSEPRGTSTTGAEPSTCPSKYTDYKTVRMNCEEIDASRREAHLPTLGLLRAQRNQQMMPSLVKPATSPDRLFGKHFESTMPDNSDDSPKMEHIGDLISRIQRLKNTRLVYAQTGSSTHEAEYVSDPINPICKSGRVHSDNIAQDLQGWSREGTHPPIRVQPHFEGETNSTAINSHGQDCCHQSPHVLAEVDSDSTKVFDWQRWHEVFGRQVFIEDSLDQHDTSVWQDNLRSSFT